MEQVSSSVSCRRVSAADVILGARTKLKFANLKNRKPIFHKKQPAASSTTMGNNHNNNETNREVEIEIFNRFSRIAKEKFSSLAISSNGRSSSSSKGNQNDVTHRHNLQRLDELYKRPEFDAERSVLEEMNNLGLRGGIFCGLACFAVLRMGPGVISRMLLQRSRSGNFGGGGYGSPFQQKSPFHSGSSNSSRGGYKFDAIPPTAFSSTTASTTTSGAEAEFSKKSPPGLFFRILRLTLDAFVSLSVGAYASVYFTDTEQMMKRFADVPLLPGRSLLSEELCDEFTKEFRKFDRQVWDEKNNHNRRVGEKEGGGGGTVDFRSTIQTFVTNCRRRHLYEEELRKEGGGGDGGGGMMSDYHGDTIQTDEPVIIPPPGVPFDIFVSLDDILGEEDQGDNLLDKNGMDDFDTYFNNNDDDGGVRDDE